MNLFSYCSIFTLILGYLPLQGQVKLEAESYASPALEDYFGDPAAGQPATLSDTPVWHSNGKIFSRLETQPFFKKLGMWEVDSRNQEVVLRATYNVGESWCISNKGDFLCAQVRKSHDNSQIKRDADSPGSLGCFRMSDGERTWQLPIGIDETIVGASYSPDDTKVALLTIQSRQLRLRLLDSSNGQELKRHDFEGPASSSFRTSALTMRDQDLLMVRSTEGKFNIIRFPFGTFKPEVMNWPELDEFDGSVKFSPGARRIAIRSETQCNIFEYQSGKWKSVYEESLPRHAYLAMNRFMGVLFHPNNQHAIIVQRDKAYVLDIQTSKIISSRTDQFIGVGALAPDGRRFLAETDNGFQILNLGTLKPDASQDQTKHRKPVRNVLFLNDGKTLASADAGGIRLWDVATRKLRAHLLPTATYCREDALESIALTNGGRSLIAEEGYRYTHWKLPPLDGRPPAKPVIVSGESALGEDAVIRDNYPNSSIYSTPDGSTIVRQDNSNLIVHPGLGTSASNKFDGAVSATEIEKGFLSPDGKSFTFFTMNNEWVEIDLESGAKKTLLGFSLSIPIIEAGNKRTYQRVTNKDALPNSRRGLAATSRDHFCLVDMDDSTQVSWLEPTPAGLSLHPTPRSTAISPDETKMVAVMRNSSGRGFMVLWDLESGKLLAIKKAEHEDCQCLAFSPDNLWLATAHYNGAVALWDVGKIAIAHPPGAEPLQYTPPASVTTAVEPDKTQPTKTNEKPLPQIPSGPILPQRRENLYGSGTWSFLENGIVSHNDLLPKAGQLRINGQDFKSASQEITPQQLLNRFHNAQKNFAQETNTEASGGSASNLLRKNVFSKIAAGLMAHTEGEADGVWLSRQIGNPTCPGGVFLTFTEAITNTTFDEKRVVVEFEVQFPVATGRLMDSTFKPVELNADGTLKLNEGAVWIAPILPEGSNDPVPIFAFTSPSSQTTPELTWKAETNQLIVRHSMTLPPAETRYLAHGLRLQKRVAGTATTIFNDPQWTDFSMSVPLTIRKQGINFSDKTHDEVNHRRQKVSSKDSFGFEWNKHRDGSLGGEMGATSVLQMWIDGAPLAYSSTSIFDCYTVEQAQDIDLIPYHSFVYGSSVDNKLIVCRRLPLIEKGKPNYVIDRITNRASESKTAKISLYNIFQSPVKSVHAAGGKVYQAEGTMSSAQTSWLALELSGDHRPATLITLPQTDQETSAVISWPSPCILRLDYQITLEPGQSMTLNHGATQRALAKFSSLTEAFSGCLP